MCPCSYFAIFGNLFGFKNFGKLVAADNIVNSLFGLLQVRKCFTHFPIVLSALRCRFTLNPASLLHAVPTGLFGVTLWVHMDQRIPGHCSVTAVLLRFLHVPLRKFRFGSHPVGGSWVPDYVWAHTAFVVATFLPHGCLHCVQAI